MLYVVGVRYGGRHTLRYVYWRTLAELALISPSTTTYTAYDRDGSGGSRQEERTKCNDAMASK